MSKKVILAKRPDIMLKLEKYGVMPPLKQGGPYEGCAQKWAREAKSPYNDPKYQAMAERLPIGWEELTEKEMNTLLSRLEEAMAQKRAANLDIPNKGEIELLRKMVKMAVLFITTTACAIEDSGIGPLANLDEDEKKRAKQFSLEMVLHLLKGTEFIAVFFRKMSSALSSDVTSQELIADFITHLTILLAILAASKGNTDRLQELLLSLKPTIQEGLDKVERFLSDGLAAGTIKGSGAEGMALYMQQARIAFEKENFKVFFNVYKEVLQLLKITPDQLLKDMKDINILAARLQNAFTSGLEDETNKLTALSRTM